MKEREYFFIPSVHAPALQDRTDLSNSPSPMSGAESALAPHIHVKKSSDEHSHGAAAIPTAPPTTCLISPGDPLPCLVSICRASTAHFSSAKPEAPLIRCSPFTCPLTSARLPSHPGPNKRSFHTTFARRQLAAECSYTPRITREDN